MGNSRYAVHPEIKYKTRPFQYILFQEGGFLYLISRCTRYFSRAVCDVWD